MKFWRKALLMLLILGIASYLIFATRNLIQGGRSWLFSGIAALLAVLVLSVWLGVAMRAREKVMGASLHKRSWRKFVPVAFGVCISAMMATALLMPAFAGRAGSIVAALVLSVLQAALTAEAWA